MNSVVSFPCDPTIIEVEIDTGPTVIYSIEQGPPGPEGPPGGGIDRIDDLSLLFEGTLI